MPTSGNLMERRMIPADDMSPSPNSVRMRKEDWIDLEPDANAKFIALLGEDKLRELERYAASLPIGDNLDQVNAELADEAERLREEDDEPPEGVIQFHPKADVLPFCRVKYLPGEGPNG